MAPSTFTSTISITHIGTATAILSIDGINFLTDPFVSDTTYVHFHKLSVHHGVCYRWQTLTPNANPVLTRQHGTY
jgi:L-ascorbate metabolism protein UlaG (beta-lactamase superfamily)